ncbi:MAG: ABC transporter ATP-binding protein, partial [Thermoanaerobaculia bacterium]
MSLEAEIHEEEKLGKVYDRRLMRRLMGYLGPYRIAVALAVVLIVASAALNLVGPLATAVTLDLYVVPVIEGGGSAAEVPEGAATDQRAAVSRWVEARLAAAGVELEPKAGIALMAAIFGAVSIAGFFLLFWQGYVMQMMGQRIMFDIRRDIFAQLQRMHIAYFDSRPVGRLVTRATTDVAALNELFTAGLVSIFGDVVMLFGIVGVLFALDWRLALVSFAVLPLLFGLTVWFKVGARNSYRQVRTQIARINAFLQEHITGMSVVQLNNREQRAASDFGAINRRHRDAHVRSIFYYAVYYPAVHLVTALGLALIVWYGGLRILQGVLSFGALVAFLQYAQRFYQPLADLSEKYNILQAAMAASERIFELLDSEPEVVSPPEPFRPREVRGAIELDRVSFGYKQGEDVLHDVSLRIEAGEMVAVVGHTGAGKSTLANLLLRFYDVGSGSIRVDGTDVRRWDLELLRRNIALVLQDVFLFAGDIAGNIRLGDASISDDKLRWAASEVEALEFVERLPEGFKTTVRERGAGLSVGQKQLLAFARALAFDPRILVLDEATASIDTETEQRIQKALGRLLADRTSIVIAHRLSTIQQADRIVVMHRGRLCEQGSHQQLLDLGGIYHKL